MKLGKLKAFNLEKRMHKWKDNFKKLLGNVPKVTDKLIKNINSKLDISLGQLKEEEIDEVLKKVNAEKL